MAHGYGYTRVWVHTGRGHTGRGHTGRGHTGRGHTDKGDTGMGTGRGVHLCGMGHR